MCWFTDCDSNGSSTSNPIAFENLDQIGGRLDILQLWNCIYVFCRSTEMDLETVVEGMHFWMADINSSQKPSNSSTLLSCITISVICLHRSATAFPLSLYIKLLSSLKSWAIAARTIPLAILHYESMQWCTALATVNDVIKHKRNEPILRNLQCFQSWLRPIYLWFNCYNFSWIHGSMNMGLYQWQQSCFPIL